MNIEFNNRIIEIVFVLAVSTLISLFGIYYFPPVILLYPVLFVILGIKQGLIYGITTLALSTLAIGFMVDISSGLLMLIAFGPLSFSLIYTIKNRKKSFEVLTISALIFLVSSIIILNIVGDASGISIVAELQAAFRQALNMQMEMLAEYELTNFEIFQIKSKLESDFKIFLNIIPSMMIMTSFIISYLNYLIPSLILRKLGYGIVFIPRFSRFKLPRNIILGIGIMFITTLLLGSLEIFNSEAVIANIYVLGFLLFFLQGLSVIDYKLIQKNIGIIFRLFIIIITTFLSSLIGGVIAITGLLDVILDFRKLGKTV